MVADADNDRNFSFRGREESNDGVVFALRLDLVDEGFEFFRRNVFDNLGDELVSEGWPKFLEAAFQKKGYHSIKHTGAPEFKIIRSSGPAITLNPVAGITYKSKTESIDFSVKPELLADKYNADFVVGWPQQFSATL